MKQKRLGLTFRSDQFSWPDPHSGWDIWQLPDTRSWVLSSRLNYRCPDGDQAWDLFIKNSKLVKLKLVRCKRAKWQSW